MKKYNIIIILLLLSVSLFAENKTITGTVIDQNRDPVIGAAVSETGFTNTAVTDNTGKFTIKTSVGRQIKITYIGYVSSVFTVDNKNDYIVKMVPNEHLLNEAVVVGYGVQKKVNITGAVSAVDFNKEMEARPLTQASNALAGMSAGVSVVQNTGKPGSDGSTIRIRGLGTLNSNSPLVIVDGVEFPLDNVNPNDIESISILKDASSTAIYGSRAANGVILVTTKKGSGKNKITYNGYFTFQNPINKLKLVSNYADFMELVNEAATNVGKQAVYSQSAISQWRAAEADPYGLNEYGVENWKAYPNTDWFNVLFNQGLLQQHNISVSGSKDKDTNYFLSVGYLDNQGIMNQRGFDSSQKKYSIRNKMETTVLDRITIGSNLYGRLSKLGTSNVDNAFNYLDKTVPGIYPGDKVGYFGQPANSSEESSNANNLFGQITGQEGYQNDYDVIGTLYSKIKLTKNLSLEGDYTCTIERTDIEKWGQPKITWDYTKNELVSETPASQRGGSQTASHSSRSDLNALLRYSKVFKGVHDFSVLLGYSQSHYNYQYFSASKLGMSDYNIHTFNSYESVVSASGSASEWALVSFFGRLNYAYDSKYLFEANLRDDGSSRFSPESRWGLFPSFSMGWRVNQEDFMSDIDWISNLKIRASWGITGNNASGNYDWQSLYSINKVTLDGETTTGLYRSKIGNEQLEWETSKTADVGIDVGVLDGKLSLESDYYYKLTNGILFTPSLYMTMGTVTGSTENIASLANQGLEFQLNWKDKIGDFSYGVSANIAFNKNVVTKYKGLLDQHWTYDESGNPLIYYNNIGEVAQSGFNGYILEKHMLGETYLRRLYKGSGAYNGGELSINDGPKDGMIRTDEDMMWVQQMVDAGYTFNGSNLVGPDGLYYGDFIYADLDGDGDYGDSDDFYFTKHSSIPKYNYGLTMNASWKGLDFYMLWQGQGGHYLYWHHSRYNGTNVSYGHSISQEVADNHYTLENRNAYYPRITLDTENNNGVTSNFWEYKGDWAKIKNVQIGYTVPKKLTGKLMVENLRIYISAENLLTLTKFPGLDPEMGTDVSYPLVKQWGCGIQLDL